MTKWIIITGGVLSGLGKGIATASIGRLLKNDLKIVTVKCDGYLNVDPGTMNPIEHGEVFVLEDGGEVDMDFGHYERFLEINCKFNWNLTSGKIFKSVIDKERKGEYLGKTVQIFPHITEEVKKRWFQISKDEKADIMMVEIGGTIGDIENSWFLEAARQLKKAVGHDNILYVHLTYIPLLSSVGEPKTKPAQRDIAQLRAMGIQPDVIIARTKDLLSKKIKEKIALFCDIEPENIINGKDVPTIYEVPLMFENEGMLNIINQKFGLNHKAELVEWKRLVNRIKNPSKQIDIAICGKYTDLHDSYASIIESLIHAGAHLDAKVNLKWIETTEIEDKKITVKDALKGIKGIIVPGGFGGRGVEGKIEMIRYARENGIPFLGLCYGLQLAVVEFARYVCKLKANTTENEPDCSAPVIDILPEQKSVDMKGGTMRLGAYTADIKKGTLVYKLYGNSEKVSERHRHRYEVNPEFHDILLKNGMVFSGTSEKGRLVEFIELPNHPFFCATQAHPELKSRLQNPAPMFYGFVDAALKI